MSLKCIEAVEVLVDALKRIPQNVPESITFFSRSDEWVYTAVYDNRVCPDCLEYEHQTLTGDMLRSLFPFLEIVDLETILVHAHMPRDDNCRCRLERVLYLGDIGREQE